MIKKSTLKKNDFVTFCIIFLATLLISRISIPIINTSGLMPDYFLALFISLIALRYMNMNIYILFFLGLLIDLLVGELIGQYGLILIIIYFTNFVLSKYFLFKSQSMIILQHFILTTIGLIILLISSLSYELSVNINIFMMKWIVTYLVCLLYSRLIQFLSNKI